MCDNRRVSCSCWPHPSTFGQSDAVFTSDNPIRYPHKPDNLNLRSTRTRTAETVTIGFTQVLRGAFDYRGRCPFFRCTDEPQNRGTESGKNRAVPERGL
jgi:hypothetical protein